MAKQPSRPRDPSQLAKMVVDIATGQIQDAPAESEESPMAQLGRAGGLRGGRARAERLSPDERHRIAAHAARKRWAKDDD